ncbi:MAG: hypothetical protein ACYDA1_00065 [Vulcanimicrobiaceae bacterium]
MDQRTNGERSGSVVFKYFTRAVSNPLTGSGKDGDFKTQVERWKRRAIEESAAQIYGAERRLSLTDQVLTADGNEGVDLGAASDRKLQRIAVAIGASGSIPLESKDYGSGFVHVFDEQTLLILLRELDIITDFVEYLRARDQLLTGEREGTVLGSEEDLLATYFYGVHSFDGLLDGKYGLMVIGGSWEDFVQTPEYRARKLADKVSYVWDRLITQVHTDFAAGAMEFGGDLRSIDGITRIMARETRLDRRALGKAFTDFMDDPKTESRLALGTSGVGYVFLKQKHAEPRKYRIAELHARCYVTRDWMENEGRPGLVVGIATELPEMGSGFSLDLILFDVPEWTADMRASAAKAREDLGFFKKPQYKHWSGDEFPASGGGGSKT